MIRMQYGEVDLDLLFVLERLLARRSVTLAAQDLGLSQPATSRALQRLRDALDDPLLVRAGHEMIPTPRALELVEPTLAALQAADAVFAPAVDFDPSEADGTFILAVGSEIQTAFGHAILRRLRAEAPGIDLRFRQVSGMTVEEGQRGLIDLAVAPDFSFLPPTGDAPDLGAFIVQPLFVRHWVLVGAPAAWSCAPDLPTYLRAHHAIMSFDGGGRGFVDDLLAQQGLSRRVVATSTSFDGVARLVASTDLLAILPAELVLTFGDRLRVFDPPVALPALPMQLVYHPAQRRHGRHRFLRNLVRDVVQEEMAALEAGGSA